MIEDPAELGRQQAQTFIACITGQSGAPAFWPTLDSDIELILAVASAHQPVVHDPWITDTDRRAADNVLALLARTRREGR